MKILFTGGGTLGPVTPLLAIFESWKRSDSSVEFLWAGTSHGPEREFVEKEGIRFFAISTARFPRYLSTELLLLPFRFFLAFAQSVFLLMREKPDLIVSAGGYTSVPIIIAGRLLGIPAWIHQQDVLPIMTNKLLAPFASIISVAFMQSLNAFPAYKTKWIGNPVRSSLLRGSKDHALKRFSFDAKKPTVLVFGGGTGAHWLNQVMTDIWMRLSHVANVIHVTGKGKGSAHQSSIEHHYHVVEYFIEEMADALAVADVVVCRSGLGSITELAALKKASILIPLPNTPQEANAKAVGDGAVVLDQTKTSPEDLLDEIRLLLLDDAKRERLGNTIAGVLPTDVAGKMIEMMKAVVGKRF